jgi:hypothetical protein
MSVNFSIGNCALSAAYRPVGEDVFDPTFGVRFRYLKVIKSVRLRVEAPFFNGSFVAFELC